MADEALRTLLKQLENLISDQYHLIKGSENELNKLKADLELMKGFLEESANKRVKGPRFIKFENQIRDAVHLAEDTVDSCILEIRKSNMKQKNPFRKLSLANEVKSLRENKILPIFSQARTDFATLPIVDESDTAKIQHHLENRKIPLLKEENVVGFDGEAETVIGYLNQDSEKLEVISIIGMPGLGKTTLAWKIYRDQRIKYEFPIRIWVYVSQEFNRRDVYRDILKHFNRRDMSIEKTDQELAGMVRSHLENKKFILFMDDVWTPENWKDIEAALPKHGKVLITSRNENVAKKANPFRNPHKLRFLTKEESWQLLQLEIYRKEDICPLDLVEFGENIATKCGGLPLAIVVIGGVLVDKSAIGGVRVTRLEWEKVSEGVSSYFLNYNKEDSTKKIIELSYDKLPYDLKNCFLYMGVFKEDTEIPAWKLIRLWIAERFIQQDSEKSLEEVAEDNLRDLINRNLVMLEKTKAEGQVKTCRVHDMIRDFCKNKAAFSEQNMFQEVKKKTREGKFYPDIPEIHLRRRLSIHSDVVDFLREKPKGLHTRSFLCFSKEVFTMPLEYNTSIPDFFNLLRVLDVNPIKFEKFPTKLAQLIHLRYIALSGDNFKILPEVFSNLLDLQTIRIDTTERTLELKVDILNMKELRHFKTKAAISLKKEAKGKAFGENLQTISRLSVQSCTDSVFTRASNLKNLGIRGDLSVLPESTCLKKLDRLQKLKLVYDLSPVSASENPLCNLPQLDRFPPNLRILTLSGTFLEWKHMATLGMLRNLEVLKLKENAFAGKFWNADCGGFLSLEFLHMGRTDLELWTASGDNPFPRLKCLIIKNCEKLEEIPLVLGESLELLDIECVDKTIVECAKKIEQQAELRIRGAVQSADSSRGFKLIISPGDLQKMTT